jgi:hypothetical protein
MDTETIIGYIVLSIAISIVLGLGIWDFLD